MQYPNVVTIDQMRSSGLSARAAWMFEGLATNQDRLDFLSVVYPNANLATIQQGLNEAQSAWEAGKQLEEGFGIPPSEQVPVSPNISSPDTFGIDVIVNAPNPNNPDRPDRIRVRVDVPSDTAHDVDMQDIVDQINAMLASGNIAGNSGLNQFPAGFQLPAEDIVSILSVTRS